MSADDLRATFLEIDDERHRRWQAAGADAEGLAIAALVATVLDWRADVVLADRAAGSHAEDPSNEARP